MRKIKGESGSIIKYYVANPISTFKKKKKTSPSWLLWPHHHAIKKWTRSFCGFSPVKNILARSAGDRGDTGLIPGSGRYSGGGNGNPVQYSCLENRLSTHTTLFIHPTPILSTLFLLGCWSPWFHLQSPLLLHTYIFHTSNDSSYLYVSLLEYLSILVVSISFTKW